MDEATKDSIERLTDAVNRQGREIERLRGELLAYKAQQDGLSARQMAISEILERKQS